MTADLPTWMMIPALIFAVLVGGWAWSEMSMDLGLKDRPIDQGEEDEK
jgi:hypothetical protein